LTELLSPRDLHPGAAIAYRPDVDGLRAIAVAIVVVFHAFHGVAPGGFVGVDVFFVISGFLISGLIFKGLEDGTFSFRTFYARRIRRILPALTLVLATTLAVGWFALLPDEYARLGRHAAAAAGFFINIVFTREAGYFDVAAEAKPLLHLWSLSVEEQFYVIWPLLMVIAARLGVRVLAVAVVIAGASFVTNIEHVQWDPVGTFFGLAARLWELAMGGALAYATSHGLLARLDAALDRFLFVPSSGQRFTAADVKGLLGVVLIVVMTLTPIRQDTYPGWSATWPTAGAFLVIWAGPRAWINRVILAHPAFVLVGLISYPLYLWHWPLLSFARIVEAGEPSVGIILGAIALSVVLAWATFQFLEKPIRSRRYGAAAPVALVACLTVTAALGLLIARDAGVPQRIANLDNLKQFEWAQLLDMHQGFVDNDNMSADCKADLFPATEVNYCLRTSRGKPVDVALLGDSHANMYFRSLSPYYASLGKNLLDAGKGGCVPLYGLEGQGVERHELPLKNVCAGIVDQILDYAIRQPSIKTVILAYRDPFYRLPTEQNQKDLEGLANPAADSFMAKYARALRETLTRLQAAGKQVVLVRDIPLLSFEPTSCVKLRPLRLSGQEIRTPCAIPRPAFEAASAISRRVLASVLKDFPNVKVFDPSRYLCDDTQCWAMRDGAMLYRDTNHVSARGSAVLARPMIEDVLK